MPSHTIDCKKVEIGDFSLTDGAVSNWTEVKTLKNSVNIQLATPTKTKFFAVGKRNPFITALQDGAFTVVLNAVDLSADNFLKFLGGTVATADGVKTWSMAKTNAKEKIAALRVTTLDNFVLVITKGSWITGFNSQLSDTQVPFIPIEVEVNDTGFPLIPDVTWTEPAA